jgi:Ran GTPase-activating protein (RanGAP) involved in mRNA processing and transport
MKGLIQLCTALGGGDGDTPPHTSLQALDIGAPIINTQQQTVVLAIASMLARNSALRELGLSKMKLTDSQLETLVEYGLLRNTSLTSLDLRANRLSGFSGPHLERVVSECRQLTTLNLEANMLGDAGAGALAGCLPFAPWLVSLNLRSNTIGEQGLRALAAAFCAPHLRRLLLWGNAFGPGASHALHEALRDLPEVGRCAVQVIHVCVLIRVA